MSGRCCSVRNESAVWRIHAQFGFLDPERVHFREGRDRRDDAIRRDSVDGEVAMGQEFRLVVHARAILAIPKGKEDSGGAVRKHLFEEIFHPIPELLFPLPVHLAVVRLVRILDFVVRKDERDLLEELSLEQGIVHVDRMPEIKPWPHRVSLVKEAG